VDDKNIVSMEQHLCKVTGKPYDTNGVLLQTKNIHRPKLDRNTLTGWGYSPEVQEKLDDGYLALVGCDEDMSDKLPNGNILPSGAWRTGNIVYIKRHLAKELFPSVDISDDLHMCFVDDEVITHCEKISKNST